MRINVLGPLTRSTDGAAPVDLACSARAAILLGSLAFSDGPVPRSTLLERLWPEREGEVPRGRSNDNLNSYATEARKLLLSHGRALYPNKANHALTLARPGNGTGRPVVDTDAHEFQQLRESGSRASVEAALNLVRGPVLAHIDEDAYPWLGTVRKRISEECRRLIRKGYGWPASRVEPLIEEFMSGPEGTLLEKVEAAAAEHDSEEASDRGFGLEAHYAPDSPSLRTLSQLVVPTAPPFYETDVTMTLREIDAECYELTYRLEITAELDEFVMALTTRASLTDLLLAECPDISDSFTCSDEEGREGVLASLSEPDPPIGIWCVGNGPSGNTYREPVPLRRLETEECAPVLGRLEEAVARDVVLVKGSLPGPRGSRRRISYRVKDPKMRIDEHYAFWVADRPTFVRRVVIDAGAFPRPVHIHPMIGNISHEWEWSDQRCDVLINNWVVKNQGVFLTW